MNSAAFIHGVRDIRIESFEPPTGDAGSVRVDVAAVGICGSDLHYYKDGGIGSAVIQQPFVPGHEFSGRIGDDIEALGLQRGDLVAVDPARPCQQCEWCHRAHHNLCPNVKFFGAPPYHGALTQRIDVPIESIVKIPTSMSADQAAMLEPLGVCIHVLDLAKPKLCESVAVLGCGAIGLGIIQLLKLSTTGSIFAIDPQAHRAKAAEQLGATHTGRTLDDLLDHTQGLGCELVIEASNSPQGFLHAVKAAKIGGRVVIAGIPDGDQYVPFPAADVRRRGLSLKFSRRMGNVYPRAIQLVAENHVDVDVMISHHFPLERTADAFEMQADEQDGLIKSMIRIS